MTAEPIVPPLTTSAQAVRRAETDTPAADLAASFAALLASSVPARPVADAAILPADEADGPPSRPVLVPQAAGAPETPLPLPVEAAPDGRPAPQDGRPAVQDGRPAPQAHQPAAQAMAMPFTAMPQDAGDGDRPVRGEPARPGALPPAPPADAPSAGFAPRPDSAAARVERAATTMPGTPGREAPPAAPFDRLADLAGASALRSNQETPAITREPAIPSALPGGAALNAPELGQPRPEAPAATPAPPTPSSNAAAQVGLQIVKAASNRVEHLRVQLEPPELGKVEVGLSFRDDGRVSAVIAADRPETLEVLQRDAQTLERGLQDAGLKTDTGGLSFALRRDAQHGRRGDGGEAKGATADASATGATPEPERATVQLRLVDIHA